MNTGYASNAFPKPKFLNRNPHKIMMSLQKKYLIGSSRH